MIDIHYNDFKTGDMVQMLSTDAFGIVTVVDVDDAGTNFYYVMWMSGEDLVSPPFEDIAWGEDLTLISRGDKNEKR